MFDHAAWIAGGLLLIGDLQHARPLLDGPAHGLSFLGSQAFYLFALPLLYWSGQRSLALRLLVLLLVVDALGSALKIYFLQPRPYWLVPALGLTSEPSFGLPSGHAAGAGVVWGALALHLRSWRWSAALVALIFAIGWSRLHLGVHFPHDVLAGWALATAILLLDWACGRRLAGLAKSLSPQRTRLAACVGALLLFAPAAWAAWRAAADPEVWPTHSGPARIPSSAAADAGALLGLWIGLGHAPAVDAPRGRFALCALGLVGLGGLYWGLGVLGSMMAAGDIAIGLLLRALRFAALTAWVVAGAPRLAQRLVR